MLVFAAVQNTIKSAAFGNINLHYNIQLFKNKNTKQGRICVFCVSFLSFVHCVSCREFCDFVTHCTMAQALKLRKLRFEKVSKSINLLCAHFWSNYVQTFFGWCKITQILCHMFFFVKKSQILGVFFGFVYEKPEGLVR